MAIRTMCDVCGARAGNKGIWVGGTVNATDHKLDLCDSCSVDVIKIGLTDKDSIIDALRELREFKAARLTAAVTSPSIAVEDLERAFEVVIRQEDGMARYQVVATIRRELGLEVADVQQPKC